MHPSPWLGRILLAITLLVLGTQAAQAVSCDPVSRTCTCGISAGYEYLALNGSPWQTPSANLYDLRVIGGCRVLQKNVQNSSFFFKNVNILNGGTLLFYEDDAGVAFSKTDFWASSIIIENGGRLFAYGRDSGPNLTWEPFGSKLGVLTIHLYGKNDAVWDRNTQQFTQQNQGALCKTPRGPGPAPDLNIPPCGIPKEIWENQDRSDAGKAALPALDAQEQPILVYDYFYKYGPLRGDGQCTGTEKSVFKDGKCRNSKGEESPNAEVGYFGNKVLAVSYGAVLALKGYKGATYSETDAWASVNSWRRLADGRSLQPGATELVLESAPDWGARDEIVVTTTDYLPGHSEKLQITPAYKGGPTVTFEAVDSPTKRIQWLHNGVRYGGPNDPNHKKLTDRLPERLTKSLDGADDSVVKKGAETRAAVALLTRSIRIVSAGDAAGQNFPAEDSGSTYSYGAHMVIRQGFKQVQIQGVEFAQMGQGGRLGHYPVHFHMARKTPPATFVKDSSINESMTRWIVLHSTLGVTLQRNVGYKSIGHGFYLEDGTESDNKFYSNIGIFARAAIDNPQNPRKVPGILADNQDPASFTSPNTKTPGFPYRSDSEYPTVFWITNGWNDFQGNMAAGAGACGAAYWFVPAVNSDMVEVPATPAHEAMTWEGYAGLQKARAHAGQPKSTDFQGTTPLKTFYMNYATSTMHSFQTTGDAPDCNGFVAFDAPPPNTGAPVVKAVRSDAPPARRRPKVSDGTEPDNLNDHYYPHAYGGSRYATKCAGDETKGYDCSKGPSDNALQARCGAGHLGNCAVTVLDHFTSSFHWAEGNISAIWLRPQWYLLTNSVISDVQNGGLTFITGGDYTHSSMVPGYWALARNTIFIGNTNPNPIPDPGPNPDPRKRETWKYAYTSNAGPFNAASPLKCDQPANVPNYCLNAAEGISMPMGGFFANQRLSNIYDGPSYQDSNAYLDITVADCPIWNNHTEQGCMYGAQINVLRLRKTPLTTPPDRGTVVPACQKPGVAYLPNAAIGWKQPNGFYYPPAFHSRNLFFSNVDLRHYVIDPLFKDGTYLTDDNAVRQQYCTATDGIFNDWTAIDRQTELTDDDGSLTGLVSNNAAKETVSVNDDSFFNAPVETAECASAIGANAKPENACKPQSTQPPQTAKTSPYEYVSTVVYHKLVAGVWDKDCSNPNCYGIPLYRQNLTEQEMTRWKRDCNQAGDKPQDKCRWPFIRMAGADISQRQTMTVNNGAYYIDTTVSQTKQKKEVFSRTASEPDCKTPPPPKVPACVRKYNVFEAAETYYVFFIYARKTTAQTYQIYVGQDFEVPRGEARPGEALPRGAAGGFSAGRMTIANENFVFTPDLPGQPTTPGIKPDYSRVATEGILTVKINFADVTEVDPTPDKLCQPRTFCAPSTDKAQCVSAVSDTDPLLKANPKLKEDISAACKIWAVKDLDCPKAGCFGFSFTLPKGFVAKDQYQRPDPEPFPKPFPTLEVKFLTPKLSSSQGGVPDDDKPDGQCYYAPNKAPVSGTCAAPENPIDR